MATMGIERREATPKLISSFEVCENYSLRSCCLICLTREATRGQQTSHWPDAFLPRIRGEHHRIEQALRQLYAQGKMFRFIPQIIEFVRVLLQDG